MTEENAGTPLGCPQCGETDGLGTIESIEGFCASEFTLVDGKVKIEGGGGTEMWWDTSVSVGVRCHYCCWEFRGPGFELKLIVPGPDPEARQVPAKVFAEAAAGWSNALNEPTSQDYRDELAESETFRTAIVIAYEMGRRS